MTGMQVEVSRSLTPEEIEREKQSLAEERKMSDLKGLARLTDQWMDRNYIKALSKGAARDDAAIYANHMDGFALGALTGVVASLTIFGIIGWIIGLVETFGFAQAGLVIVGWIFIAMFFFKNIRKALVAAARWVAKKLPKRKGKS